MIGAWMIPSSRQLRKCSRKPSAPDFVGLGVISDGVVGADGAVRAPAFRQWVSDRQRECAQILKQTRLYDGETKSQRQKWRGQGEVKDKGDGGEKRERQGQGQGQAGDCGYPWRGCIRLNLFSTKLGEGPAEASVSAPPRVSFPTRGSHGEPKNAVVATRSLASRRSSPSPRARSC